jgi:hypothetical protein
MQGIIPFDRGSAQGLGRIACPSEEGQASASGVVRHPRVPFAMDFEAMIRLFIAPRGTKEQIIATLQQVRSDAQEMLRFSGHVKREFLDGRAALQDQVHIRALAVDFS